MVSLDSNKGKQVEDSEVGWISHTIQSIACMEDWRGFIDLRKEWLEISANHWSLNLGSNGGGLPNITS